MWHKVPHKGGKRETDSRKGRRRMFKGEYNHTLDAKGRIVIPSKVREELGSHFVITKAFDQCLYLFPDTSWEKFVEKINSLPASREKVRRVQRRFIGSSWDCEPDKQGRFLIPPKLREYAGITRDVVLVGLSDRLEVWSLDKWIEYCDEEDESIDDIAGDLVF